MLFLGIAIVLVTEQLCNFQIPPRFPRPWAVYPKGAIPAACSWMAQAASSQPGLTPSSSPLWALSWQDLSSCPWSHPPDRLMMTFRGVWLQDVSRAAVLLVQAGLAITRGSSGENPASYFSLQALPSQSTLCCQQAGPQVWPTGSAGFLSP